MRNAGAEQTASAVAEDYDRLLAREPNSLRFAEYADHLRRLGKLPDAIAVCERGLARHPRYCTGRVIMAEIMLDADQPELAVRQLEGALRLDRYHPRAHLLLGELLLARGQLKGAAAEFEAALVSSPGLTEARAGLAKATGTALAQPAGPPQKAQDGDKPGQRPEWLTPARSQELLALVVARGSVESAQVVDADGRLLACSNGSETGLLGQAVVGFVNDLRALASRLGAGRLRSAAVYGTRRRALCLPLGDMLLLACLRPDAHLDAAATELHTVIAAGPHDGM